MRTLKIGFTGSHGTGKTTLVNALKERLDAMEIYRVAIHTIPTIARTCPFPINGAKSKSSPDAQTWIIMSRIIKELELSNPEFNPFRENVVLIDSRTVIDDFAYLMSTYPEHRSIDMEMKICQYWMSTYDYVFYLPIEFPIDDDGERNIDVDYQKKIDSIIVGELHELGIPKIPLYGDVGERLDTIMRYIRDSVGEVAKERIDDKRQTLNTLSALGRNDSKFFEGELLS